MTETKKQHFVPRTYLRNFAHLRNDDFYVNVLQKNQPCEKIFESNITNICAENHLYTLTGDTESRQLLENIYSNIFENEYKDLFSVLTNDTIYEITGEMKKSIVSALITMFYRTKKWVNEYNSFNDESMNKVYQVCKQFNVDSFTNPNGEQINIKDKSLGELQSNLKKSTRIPIVLSQLKVALRLIDAKQFDNINVFKIIDNCEFITSDNPVLAMNVNKMPTIPFDIDNAYYLPISAKYLLSIFPKEDLPANNKIIRMIMSKEKVLGFNKWQ
jgi:flagellar biosynthesis/type III secretory pathway chaperone